MTPLLLSASSLTGDAVVNHEGERLGTLKDLMINVGEGAIAYAVLRRGGVGGIGIKLFAVPWHLLSVDTDERCLRLDVSASVLDDSPGFNPDQWPAVNEVGWTGSHPEPNG